MIGDQKWFYIRVLTLTWKIRAPTHPIRRHLRRSARLGSARLHNQPSSLAPERASRSHFSRARIARRAAAGADSLDIYMHTRYHSGEQSTRGTRTNRVSSCSPSLLLRPKERKEERRSSQRERERERLEERSVSAHLPRKNLRRQKSSEEPRSAIL